jgi:hypothetical protein
MVEAIGINYSVESLRAVRVAQVIVMGLCDGGVG